MARHQTGSAQTEATNPHAPVQASAGPLPVPGGALGEPPEGTLPKLVGPTVTASVVDPSKAGLGPKVKRYRVLNGGMVAFRGHKTPMRAGKEIDENNYNIAELKRQGIQLEEIVPEPEA